MFVTVTPTEANSLETLCSLNFGARVRGLTLGPAKRHIEPGGELAQLRTELISLRNQVLCSESHVTRCRCIHVSTCYVWMELPEEFLANSE
jgi:hypothetical protein